MPKPNAKARKSGPRKAGKPRGSPTNIPTVVADPKFAITLHMVDESADALPFQGDVTYAHIMAAAARQIHSHLPTPLVLPEDELTKWYDLFNGIFHWIQIESGEAWGTPFIDMDKGSSTRFEFSLHANNEGVLPPRPAVTDSAAGASDRPYGRQRGGALYFADQGNANHRCMHLTSADVVHLHVRIW